MKKWNTILIAILTAIILIQYFGRKETPYPVIKPVKTDTIYIPKAETIIRPGRVIYKPGIPDTTIIYDTTILQQNIDTAAILNRYFAKAVYKDTLKNDSIAFIFVQDTVTENRIASRQKIIQVHPIFQYEIPARKLFVGVGLGGNMNKFSFTGQILYLDRRDRMFGISYDPINKATQFSMFWKLKFRQKTAKKR